MTVAPRLRPGHNCQTVAQASRASVLIDGEEYFRAFAQAALRATRSIVIVGWDFDSRTALHLEQPGVPELLGEFLNFLARKRRALQINILVWDAPLVFSAGREPSPAYGLGWRPHRRVHFRYDKQCALGASLHQKLVVIDAAVGFCGGFDLTRSRWDTSAHRADEPRRVNPGENDQYAPFHDVMLMVEGDIARTMHELAADRWQRTTGDSLPRVVRDGAIPRGIRRAAGLHPAAVWPKGQPAHFNNVQVGLARTVPASDADAAVTEVQSLYLDMIAAARRCIYLENQYFSANVLGEALARRLAEPDGPEIIAVLRRSAAGWLEAPTMGTLRTVMLTELRAADRYKRLHVFYPVVPDPLHSEAMVAADVHTKLMIVDDEWLRVGSANFANRSLWLDSECDLVIEAAGDSRCSAAIAGVRSRLLAEHLDVPVNMLERTTAQTASLSAVIATLMRSQGRTLRHFEQVDAPPEMLIAASLVADPCIPRTADESDALV